MLRRTLLRLAATLSLALGATAVLFLIFDSGILGDPALRVAGPHAGPREVGETRLRLGSYSRFEPEALLLEAPSPPLELVLRAESGGLVLALAAPPTAGAALDLDGLDLEGAARALEEAAASLGAALRVRAAPGLGDLPASGLAAALADGAPLQVGGASPAGVPWAEAVPAPLRFLHQSWALLRLDLGRSLATGRPLGPEILQRGLRSAALTVPALLLATLLAVGLVLAALARPRMGRALSLLSLGGLAISSLVWVLVLRDLLVRRLALFPAQGWATPLAAHLALPILTWVAVALGPEFRFHRAVLAGSRAQGTVTAARARGLPARRVLLRHLLRPSLVPILARLFLAVPFLFLGSLLLEQVFAIPGLGGFTFEAVQANDPPALRAITWVVALLYLASQWLGDLLCAAMDPRWRR